MNDGESNGSRIEPPLVVDPKRIYRVWYNAWKDSNPVVKMMMGFITFVREGNGYGIRVEQPDDTTAYFAYGTWTRVQEYDASKVRE
jgi:hypothetical protein